MFFANFLHCQSSFKKKKKDFSVREDELVVERMVLFKSWVLVESRFSEL